MNRIALILACMTLVCTATPRHRSHRDGDFKNFNAFDGFSSGSGGYGSDVVIADVGGGYEGSDGFDPRLPDPPCVWTAWSSCDSACGGGVAFRLRRITEECSYGPESQTRPCNTNPCPQDCELGEWTEWGGGCCECSVPCGGGVRSRTRAVLSPALFGGACDLDTVQTESCNTEPCPVDCIASSLWTAWGACTSSCGGGVRTRSRQTEFVTVVRPGNSQSDAQCPSSFEEEPCNTQECGIDCLVSPDWTEWSSCSETCGDGQQTRTRRIVVFPQNGGGQCPETMETRSCLEGFIELPLCNPVVPHFKKNRRINEDFRPRFPTRPIVIPPTGRKFPQQPKFPVQPQPIPAIQAQRVPKPVFQSQPTTPLTIDPNFCLNKADGPYAHPQCNCCNDLIMCFQRSPVLKWCPAQQVFDQRFRKCVTRAQAGC